MKGLLIDPEEKAITTVEVVTLGDILKTVSCKYFEMMHLGPDHMFFDESGRGKTPFTLVDADGVERKIGGKALVLGDGGDGENADHKIAAEELKRFIVWDGDSESGS